MFELVTITGTKKNYKAFEETVFCTELKNTVVTLRAK